MPLLRMPSTIHPVEALAIEVTSHCNRTCPHCFAIDHKNNQASSYDIATIKEIIEEGAEAGFTHLHLTGGEPLLWPHLFSSIGIAGKAGYTSISINTNGELLNRKWARGLKELSEWFGLSLELTITVNGPEKIHESLRGSQSYCLAMRGLELAIEEQLEVIVFTTMTASLLDLFPAFAETIISTGVSSLFLLQLARAKPDTVYMNEMLSPEDFNGFVTMADFLRLRSYPIFFLDNPLSQIAAITAGIQSFPRSLPQYRKGLLTILQNGRMGNNHFMPDDIKNDRYYQKGRILDSFLNNETLLHDPASVHQACGGCLHIELCSSHHMHSPTPWYYSDRIEDTPDHLSTPFFCQRVLQGASSG